MPRSNFAFWTISLKKTCNSLLQHNKTIYSNRTYVLIPCSSELVNIFVQKAKLLLGMCAAGGLAPPIQYSRMPMPKRIGGGLKVCLNRYSWGAGKVGSEYSSWFIRLECISWQFLTMSRLCNNEDVLCKFACKSDWKWRQEIARR